MSKIDRCVFVREERKAGPTREIRLFQETFIVFQFCLLKMLLFIV